MFQGTDLNFTSQPVKRQQTIPAPTVAANGVQVADHETRIDALEAADLAIDSRLDALEASDTALDGRLDVLEAQTAYVATTIRFTPTTTPASPVAGMTYFDSGTFKLRTYDGTAWQDHW